MSVVYTTTGERFDAQVPLLIVGAGAAGLCAALAAKEGGVEAVLVERDAVPSGSTALPVLSENFIRCVYRKPRPH